MNATTWFDFEQGSILLLSTIGTENHFHRPVQQSSGLIQITENILIDYFFSMSINTGCE